MKQIFTIRERKFSILHSPFSIVWLLAAMLLFTGCPSEIDPDNPDDPNNTGEINNPPAAVMQSATVSGTVLDISGSPLSGVSVSTGTENATTGSDGTFTFSKAGTVNDRAVFRLEKAGYFPLTRSAVIDSIGEIAMQAMLCQKGNSGISLQTDFDAGSAKTLQAGGFSVSLPAGSVVKADGSAYSGTVHADVLYLAPDNANASLLMPGGDLTAGKDKNSEDMMLPYGIANVELTDPSGNPLNVGKDAGVEIAFPAPESATDASISLWTFSDARGVWLEEGTLTKQGNVYKGAVNHFSPPGAGKKFKKVILRTQVAVCDKPKAGVKVEYKDFILRLTRGEPAIIFSGITNSEGYCSTNVPADIKAIYIGVTYNGKKQAQAINSGPDFGKQVVVFNFDDGCPGNITFNLKAGPTQNSFIIACNPAMPAYNNNPYSPPSYVGKRIPPNMFLKQDVSTCYIWSSSTDVPGLGFGIPNGGLIYGGCDQILNGGNIFVAESSGWNADYTEFTYIL
jgi:hypothetical protein